MLWIVRMRGCAAKIWWLAFTFDRQDVADALIACKRAGHQIRFGADYNMTVGGRTRDQVACFSRLNANGVEVNLIRGYPLGPVYQSEGRQSFGNLQGIQHCKSFYAEISMEDAMFKSFVIGSSNWTLSSRRNCEMISRRDPRSHGRAAAVGSRREDDGRVHESRSAVLVRQGNSVDACSDSEPRHWKDSEKVPRGSAN